ncbi:uncharacterized protein LOC144617283 [Panthera onca]
MRLNLYIQAAPEGLMQELPSTKTEEAPITLPQGETTVMVHSIYSGIGNFLRTTLADSEGSINDRTEEVSIDSRDGDTTSTSESTPLECESGNYHSNEAQDVPPRTTISIKKGDFFWSHIRCTLFPYQRKLQKKIARQCPQCSRCHRRCHKK